ncbi:uncharacterized protein isoform X1 [Leptinotarsa decemlineata]|uniref:uncharacterized protein isoform X1 n=1 Tax=Leptinotarsa decemlineata TaxID=7539 RepID=UPI003D30556A
MDIFPNKNDIYRHSKREQHIWRSRQVSKCTDISDIAEMAQTPKFDAVKYAEIKLAGFVAYCNLPFTVMDTLTTVCSDIFKDSSVAKALTCKRTKATTIIRENLGKYFREELFAVLRKPGMFFSLIMDETTDIGTIKQCAFSVIFFSEIDDRVITKFFYMLEVESGKADDLYKVLKTSLYSKGIPFNNLVGFASDTTNVMIGNENSIFSHLKADLPQIACIKCSCHLMHLAASKACMELPKRVDDVLRNIGAHFSRSSSKQLKFKEFQLFFGTELHKILPSQTKWLSVEVCCRRFLEPHEPLKAYFREIAFEDPSYTTDAICETLNNKFTKIYLEFMAYILHILNDFNTLFQSETPLLHRLKPEILSILKIVYNNYLDIKHFEKKDLFKFDHKNPHYFLSFSEIYIGIEGQESL